MANSEREVEYDVIVVGAGISGLTAARSLLQKEPSLKILVLEGKDRVGGRTLTVQLKTANHTTDDFDLGGQWIGRTQTEATSLLEELGLELYEQYEEGKKMAVLGVADVRSYSATLPFWGVGSFAFTEIFDFIANLFRHERLSKKVNLLDTFSWKDAEWADRQSVGGWAESVSKTRSGRDAFAIAIRAIYGVDPRRISFLYHLLYTRSAGGFLNLTEASGNGAQAFKIKGGAQQISKKMAAELGPTVQLKKVVRAVETGEGQSTTVTLQTGEILSCRRLILAIPPNQCEHINFSPPLPYLKRRLFQNATPGHYIKFIVTYGTAFWREDGRSGEIISTGKTIIPGETTAIVVSYDATSSRGSPAIVGFINEELHDSSRSERCNAVVQDLIRFLGDKALSQFIAYEEKVWAEEPLNGGCPVDFISPGNMDAFLSIRDMHYGVHFAGTETAIQWIGYMHGAIEAGKRAANEVLVALQLTENVDYKYLKGTQFSVDFKPHLQPSDHYVSSLSPWWRRSFFALSLLFGVYAVSKKYDLSYTARFFRPAEKTIFRLWTGGEWPS